MGKPALAILAAALIATLSSCAIGTPGPATDVTNIGATLNGSVYSSVEGNTTWWFDYGDTPDYGSATADATVAIADDEPHPVSAPIYGLLPDTTYHFRMCVKDAQEEPPRMNCSKDNTFTMLAETPFVTADGTELRLDGAALPLHGHQHLQREQPTASAGTRCASGSGLDDALDRDGPGEEAIRAWFFQSLATSGGERDWSALRPHARGRARPRRQGDPHPHEPVGRLRGRRLQGRDLVRGRLHAARSAGRLPTATGSPRS